MRSPELRVFFVLIGQCIIGIKVSHPEERTDNLGTGDGSCRFIYSFYLYIDNWCAMC